MKKLILILCCVIALVSCRQEQTASQEQQKLVPENADTETCAACGMVVREQPAPRGQVIRRDGSREFLCSIDDLVHYLEVPSPKGKPAAIYVEVMPEEHQPLDLDTTWRVWSKTNDLFFVTGIKRGAVMGDPALTYKTKITAEKIAGKFAGKMMTFDELRTENKK